MSWMQWLFIIGAGVMVWLGYRMFKSNPEAFSKENFSRSVGTLGWLAIMLIAVVGFCVWMLK